MTDDDWRRMRALAEARNGEHRDSRQCMAEAVLRHESEITELKECVALLIQQISKDRTE